MYEARIANLHNSSAQAIANRLYRTGWQSWSTGGILERVFHLPPCNTAPQPAPARQARKVRIPPKNKPPAVGWCSWYAHGWAINEARILRQARWIAANRQLPLAYALVD